MNEARVQIWSAAPTPLTPELRVDVASLERMVRHAVDGGIDGLFLAGTCGEGPWLPDRERRILVQRAASVVARRLKIAVQVSDNSVPRILDNMHAAAEAGADCAMIAPPATMMNATPERIAALFTEAVEASPLPVGIYDLGRHRPIMIPQDRLKGIYLLPNVQLVKDSSGAPERSEIALAARRERPSLQLFNGDEFRCVDYLQAGYNGLMFGGAAAVTSQLHRIVDHFLAGRLDEARAAEAEMRDVLLGIYGGPSIACWLTGLKYYLVRCGVFSSAASYLSYPLTEECRAFINRYTASRV